MSPTHPLEVITLTWDVDERQTRSYVLTGIDTNGQLAILGTREEGPFDTVLETAQWAWRVISRALPPSAG